MSKHFDKRNLWTFYVREKHKEIWKKFLDFIKTDSQMIGLGEKKNHGLISIALMQLVYEYVKRREGVVVQSEAPD